MDTTIFRNYTDQSSLVAQTYKLNHENQTVEYVQMLIDKYCAHFDKCKMSIWDAIYKLDNIVDESDPDLHLSQIHHAFQAAEGIRKIYPNDEILHLIGLLHDVGKVLLLPEFGQLPQWSVVGDTYPVGCNFSNKIVYSEYFKQNSDLTNPQYSTQLGIYTPKCGLDNLLFSFSHDIYLYSVLKHNGALIPEKYLKIVRYHSAYVIHKDNEYDQFMKDEDYETRELCKQFSYCDLYTKDDRNKLNIEELMPYYDKLIKKYIPKEILNW